MYESGNKAEREVFDACDASYKLQCGDGPLVFGKSEICVEAGDDGVVEEMLRDGEVAREWAGRECESA